MRYSQKMRFAAIIFLCLLFSVLPHFGHAAQDVPLPTVVGSGSAVEGDVLSVNGQVVRLWGIDAPEVKQTCTTRFNKQYDCFTPSKNMLSSYIGTKQVTCYIRGQDSNGQKVGTCGVNGLDLAALMVKSGWALAYIDLSPQYVELEGIAQSEKRGLWGGIRVEPPWSWRSRQQAAQNK